MKRLTGKRAVWLGLVATPVLVVAAVATIGVAGSSAGPATTAQSAAPVGINTAVNAAAIEAFWTPARMQSAQDMSSEATAKPDSFAEPEIAGDTATGAPGVAGGMTASGQRFENVNTSAIAQTSGGELPADGAYPGPKTAFLWYPRYVTYPQGTVGKMFFQQDHDNNGSLSSFSCSAAVTVGARVDTVWTAGHCMHNGFGTQAGWSTNINFCPSYLNGSNPLRGCWAWDGVGWTHGNWYNGGNFDSDWAGFQTASTGTVHAAQIANVTGGLGFAWNWGRDQHWWNWGYPALPSAWFDGGDLNLCTAEHRYDLNSGTGPSSNSMGCTSGRGSSGGPWVINLNAAGGAAPAYINSVNSWLFFAEEGAQIQGPYADTNACIVWDTLTQWSGSC